MLKAIAVGTKFNYLGIQINSTLNDHDHDHDLLKEESIMQV